MRRTGANSACRRPDVCRRPDAVHPWRVDRFHVMGRRFALRKIWAVYGAPIFDGYSLTSPSRASSTGAADRRAMSPMRFVSPDIRTVWACGSGSAPLPCPAGGGLTERLGSTTFRACTPPKWSSASRSNNSDSVKSRSTAAWRYRFTRAESTVRQSRTFAGVVSRVFDALGFATIALHHDRSTARSPYCTIALAHVLTIVRSSICTIPIQRIRAGVHSCNGTIAQSHNCTGARSRNRAFVQLRVCTIVSGGLSC